METSSLQDSPEESPRVENIERALKRYEEEIQHICRSNAEMRASYQPHRSSPLRQSALRTDRDRQDPQYSANYKLQLKIQSLEDYVKTLEARLSNSHRSSGSYLEVSALRAQVDSLTADNDSLLSQVSTLSSSLQDARHQLENVAIDHSATRQSRLEDAVNTLQREVTQRTQENTRLAECYRALEREYRELQDSYRNAQRREEEILREEVRKSRDAALQKDQENVRLIKKMHDFVRESELAQAELHRRISVLEGRTQEHQSTVHRHSHSTRERHPTAPRRKNSKSMVDAGAVYQCEKCKTPSRTRLSKSPIGDRPPHNSAL